MLEISTILKNAQAGDGESMELILKSFKSKVNAICREYFLIGSDFDDILQEGMIGLYKAIQTVNFDGDYSKYLNSLIQINDTVTKFFDDVLVMDKDEKIKNNRLALLNTLKNKYIILTDFSQL